MKVLILHPDFRDPGGVAAYYRTLEKYYTQSIEHFIIGRRPDETGIYKKINRMMNDYRQFVKKMKNDDYDIIHVNPSLDIQSIIRDGIFIMLARIYKKKTLAFIHGWHESHEEIIQKYGKWQFKLFYGKVSAFIVLAEAFKKKLLSWGFKQSIYREVIVIDDNILKEFNIHKTIKNRSESEEYKILFLSRIVREKGIYETIETVSLLSAKYPQLELTIAGDGRELENVKNVVQKRFLKNVIFAGYVKNEEKYRLLKKSNIMIFPTYSEGFPNTIVEGMAFGLPIVTRPVGGIADFFKNGEHGFATSSKNPVDFANYIEKILKDIDLCKKMSMNNYEYAKLNLLASRAVLRMEKIYESVLGK